jgi:hypothetical protein
MLLAVIATGPGGHPAQDRGLLRRRHLDHVAGLPGDPACELRATGITFDKTAAGFLREAVPSGIINVIANEPNERDEQEYRAKWRRSGGQRG